METNHIYCGDAGRVLSQFPEGSVDLIYADPPFFSNRHYEIIWGDGYEIRAFEDRWKGGIENYIAWMEPKLRECHRILKDSGSMYLHSDWHASAYLKVEMDKTFGINNFRNEISWPRTYAHGDFKQGATSFGHIHDTILFYAKTDKNSWNQLYVAYEKDYVEKTFKLVDEKGRRYQTVTLTASKPGGDTKFEWHGITPPEGRYWAYSKANLEKMEREGKIVFLKSGIPRLKKYLDESPGVPVQDVWDDIRRMSTFSKERVGFPTQKPVALLDRIIRASSKPSDIVLDPFCGCGTTLVAAQTIKDMQGKPAPRKWIGVDVSPTACKLMASRMRTIGFSIDDKDILGLPRTLNDVKTMQPFEFQNWACQQLGGRVNERKIGDLGIDGWLLDKPIQVKQSSGVGRNVVDNFETALRRVKKIEGIIVAFDFGKGAYEEVARAKLEDGLAIRLMTVEDILSSA